LTFFNFQPYGSQINIPGPRRFRRFFVPFSAVGVNPTVIYHFSFFAQIASSRHSRSYLTISLVKAQLARNKIGYNIVMSGSSNSKPQTGFTLVELLVVIALVSIIAAVALVVINPVSLQNRAKDGALKGLMNKVAFTANSLSAANGGLYPTRAELVAALKNATDLGIRAPGPTQYGTSGIYAAGLDNAWEGMLPPDQLFISYNINTDRTAACVGGFGYSSKDFNWCSSTNQTSEVLAWVDFCNAANVDSCQ